MKYNADVDELSKLLIIYSKKIGKELPDEKDRVKIDVGILKRVEEVSNLLINDLNVLNLNLRRRINERILDDIL